MYFHESEKSSDRRVSRVSRWRQAGLAMAVAGCVCLGIGTTALAQTTVKLAHTETGSGDMLAHPYFALTSVLGRYIDQQTQGEYELQVFPNGQLGDLESQANQNADGIVQMTAGLSPGHLSSWAPNVQVLELPYAFPNRAVAFDILNYGEFGKALADDVAEESGIRILAYTPSAFRSFSNNERPVRSAADMEGLKIRVQQFPVYIELVNALGANPTPIAWSELYNALQTGVVDGQENAPYTMLLANLQEVQSYYTLDQHVMNISLITINEDFYQGLSDEHKQVFRLAAVQAATAFVGIVNATEGRDLQTIVEADTEIYAPTAEERQTFVDATREPMLRWAEENMDREWAERLLEAVEMADASF